MQHRDPNLSFHRMIGLERNTTSTTNNHHASYVPHRIGTPTVHAALAGLALGGRVPGGTGNAETAAIEKNVSLDHTRPCISTYNTN